MQHIYDLIILGGGPAGYTAGLYASRAGLDVLIIEKMTAGGQMTLTGDIENYPGYDEGIDGFSLGAKMQSGAERFGAKTLFGEVISVSVDGDIKKLRTYDEEYFSRALIIATGAEPKPLGVEKEENFVGRGIHYCAHCDGRFYKGKTAVVIGGGNSALTDALYLSHLCENVILVHRRDNFRASHMYAEQVKNAENITLVMNSEIVELITDKRVSGVKLKNVLNGDINEISCDGVFVSIGRNPESKLFKGVIELDKSGYIIATEETKTNIPGVFAAGDVRTKVLRQIVTATADGAVAAHFAEEYLNA